MAIPIFWRTKQQRYSLRGAVCPECSQAVFPPRKVCPYCCREQEQPAEEVYARETQVYAFVLPQPVLLSAAGDD